MSVLPFSFPHSWLTEADEAHVILVQPRAAKIGVMLQDASRPESVQTVKGLLGDSGRLTQIASGQKPAIILLPELAFSSDDWGAIDELVRATTRPILLIAGFGFTTGRKLTKWEKESNGTTRRAGWSSTSQPATERVYNGAWCWVHHQTAGTTCIAFLKTTAEQSGEIQVPLIDVGSDLVCLEFQDLLVFPVICSDFLAAPAGKNPTQQSIAAHVASVNGSPRILIAGLLLQEKESGKWRNAISDTARQINTKRVNVSLVNCASDILARDEDKDRWRDYTGIYIAAGRHPHGRKFFAVREFASDALDASVVRGTEPMVVGGAMRWDFQDPTGRHLWSVHTGYPIESSGAIGPAFQTDKFEFETLRLLKRISSAPDSEASSKAVFALHALTQIEAQVVAPTAPYAEQICSSVLRLERKLCPDQMSDVLLELSAGLKCLGALKSCPGIDWSEGSRAGQLYCQSQSASILVWSTPHTAITHRRMLNDLRNALVSSNVTIAFHRASGGNGYPAPDGASDRRRDITSPPTSVAKSWVEPRLVQKFVEVSLDEIELAFDETQYAGPADLVGWHAALAALIEKHATSSLG